MKQSFSDSAAIAPAAAVKAAEYFMQHKAIKKNKCHCVLLAMNLITSNRRVKIIKSNPQNQNSIKRAKT